MIVTCYVFATLRVVVSGVRVPLKEECRDSVLLFLLDIFSFLSVLIKVIFILCSLQYSGIPEITSFKFLIMRALVYRMLIIYYEHLDVFLSREQKFREE